MDERFKWLLGGAWLLASCFFLILPVFLPSYPSDIGANPIGLSTAAMLVFSFPASLLSFVLSPIAELVLGVDPNSMAGMYLNVKMLFVLGLAQWFWAFPRLVRGKHTAQISEISASEIGILPQYTPPADVDAFDSQSRTPVERVFDDEK
jgi:hypothetical protein